MADERLYIIRDARGNECKTTYIRVISCDELAIGHPIVPDVLVNTRRHKTLPVSCRGDLTDPIHVETQREFYEEIPFKGNIPVVAPNSIRSDPVIAQSNRYNGHTWHG